MVNLKIIDKTHYIWDTIAHTPIFPKCMNCNSRTTNPLLQFCHVKECGIEGARLIERVRSTGRKQLWSSLEAKQERDCGSRASFWGRNWVIFGYTRDKPRVASQGENVWRHVCVYRARSRILKGSKDNLNTVYS